MPHVEAPQDGYLLCSDVARELGIGADAVRALVKSGRIKPATVTVSGTRLFTRAIVDAEISRRRDEERKRRASRKQGKSAA
jgi:hypothetical protein